MIPWFLWLLRTRPTLLNVFFGSSLFGLAYHLVYFSWFTGLHPLTWLGLSEWQSAFVAGFAWIGISLLGGFLVGILGLTFALLHTRLPGIFLIFLFPLIWVLGFRFFPAIEIYIPWALLEYTQSGLPWARGIAALAGGSAVAYLIVLHNLLGAKILENTLNASHQDWPRTIASLILIPLLLLIPSGAAPPEKFPFPVAVIQGNLPIETVRSEQMRLAVSEKAYLTPLRKAPFPPGTLVVLPEEGIIPGWVNQEAPGNNPSLAALASIARNQGWFIASGMSTYQSTDRPEETLAYNSIGVIDGYSQQIAFYNKERRVPFGEYTPNLGIFQEGWLQPLMAMAGVEYANVFAAGKNNPPIVLTGPHSLGGLVCFELIDPDLAMRHKRAGADLLINSSNLGWFHGHSLLEAQFIAIGQIRAAETGLPVVIAANTGVSALIDRHGRILQRTPSLKPATLFLPF